MSKKWQNLEKTISKALNTSRSPFSGSNSGVTASDSLHPDLYIECKCHQNQAVLSLMHDTEDKAIQENKTPIVVLSDPTDLLKRTYVMFNLKDIFNIMKEIDLNELNKNIPDGTTVSKLLESQKTGSDILIRAKEDIEKRITAIFRNKILSKDEKEILKTLCLMSFCIDTIKSYSETTLNE